MNPESFDLLSRQIIFIGMEKQEKLSRSKVVVIGAGGLGSHVSEMLIKAGIGTVRVIDRDLVDETNLARVAVFTRDDIGKPKALVIAERFKNLNSDVRIDPKIENLTAYSAEKLLSGFDIVVDCTDNMETRYTINDFCVKNRKHWIYGAVIRDEGLSSTFKPGGKPCFSCLYFGRRREAEKCCEVGVISPIIGIIASWEVMEVFKILTGLAEPNYGKLLRVSLKEPKLEFVKYKAKENCEVCGK